MMCPEELVTLITATAISISNGKSSEELNLLSSLFVQLGDTIATLSTQRNNIESVCKKTENSNTKY